MQKKPDDERFVELGTRLPRWARIELYNRAKALRHEGDQEMTLAGFVRKVLLDYLEPEHRKKLEKAAEEERAKKKEAKRAAAEGRRAAKKAEREATAEQRNRAAAEKEASLSIPAPDDQSEG